MSVLSDCSLSVGISRPGTGRVGSPLTVARSKVRGEEL